MLNSAPRSLKRNAKILVCKYYIFTPPPPPLCSSPYSTPPPLTSTQSALQPLHRHVNIYCLPFQVKVELDTLDHRLACLSDWAG